MLYNSLAIASGFFGCPISHSPSYPCRDGWFYRHRKSNGSICAQYSRSSSSIATDVELSKRLRWARFLASWVAALLRLSLIDARAASTGVTFSELCLARSRGVTIVEPPWYDPRAIYSHSPYCANGSSTGGLSATFTFRVFFMRQPSAFRFLGLLPVVDPGTLIDRPRLDGRL